MTQSSYWQDTMRHKLGTGLLALLGVALLACASQAAAPSSDAAPSAPADAVPGSDSGSLAYDFTLPGADGQDHSLSALRGQKNVVLVFYRGFW